MVGFPEDAVELHPYSAWWPWLFRWERLRLWLQIGPFIRDIQHIGSTAIPGMIAKPILDIAVGVADFERAFGCVDLVEQIGYKYQGENAELRHYYFIKGDPPTHYLYLMDRAGEEWKSKIRFRDYLIRHPDAAHEYAELKRKLAVEFASDRRAYQDAKLEFVRKVLKTAQQNN